MKVFTPVPEESFEWVVPVDERDFEVFGRFDGSSLSTSWRPVPVRLVRTDEFGRTLRDSDFPWLGGDALVLRARAEAALRRLVSADAELLPLACEEAQLWVVNVRRVVDALDQGRAEVIRFANSTNLMKITKHAFREEAIRGVALFKIPELIHGTTFVAESVVREVVRWELTGIRFEPVWDSDVTLQGRSA